MMNWQFHFLTYTKRWCKRYNDRR